MTTNHGGDDTTFVWNWDSKLRSVSIGPNSISLKYDPMGNRVYKNSAENGTRKYIIDISGELPTILLAIDPNNSSLNKKYIYGNSQILAQHDVPDNNEPYFYLHDRLGSVRLVIDDEGDVENSYTYNAFGEMFPSECSETASNPFKFTGQFFDDEIGQYYLRARQYDPVLMRFTSRDPVRGKFREPLTLHKYLYCYNEPINRIDIDGRIGLYFAARVIIGGIVGGFNSYKSSGGDTWATIVGVTCGMFSGAISDPVLGLIAGTILGGTSTGIAEYRQHGTKTAFAMGFMSGAVGGIFTGGIGLKVHIGTIGLDKSGVVGLGSFLGSQFSGAVFSAMFGAPVDTIHELEKFNEERNEVFDKLEEEMKRRE